LCAGFKKIKKLGKILKIGNKGNKKTNSFFENLKTKNMEN